MFDRSIELLAKLERIPGFPSYLNDSSNDPSLGKDPVSLLWSTFRKGYPLMYLISLLNDTEFEQPVVSNQRTGKEYIYKFRNSCKDLYGESELFGISEIYKDDSSGYVKVLTCVEKVVNQLMLKLQGKLLETTSKSNSWRYSTRRKMSDASSNREKSVLELLETERNYVKSLETLQVKIRFIVVLCIQIKREGNHV